MSKIHFWKWRGVERQLLKQELRERHGERCYWCRMPMDFSAEPNSPMSPTLEHMKRKRDGGQISLENCRLAHRACNQARETLWSNAISLKGIQ